MISKLSISKSSGFNKSKIIQIPKIEKIAKLENKKDNTEYNYYPKKIKLKKIKVIYRPIHPENRYNSSTIGIDEILKKDNLPFITNDSIKNLVLKFREEREKEMLEKKVIYKDKSFEEIQKEKNTHFLMLRAMLRKDPLTIQVLMKRNREEERKLKKNASMMSLLRNRSKKKYINRTTYLSEEDVTNEKSFNNNDIENSRLIIPKKNKFSKNEVWKNDFLSKAENIRKSYLKKYETKIRSVNSLVLGGRLSPFKVSHSPDVKFNQDCIYANINLNTTKLDEISLFGIFDGNGQYGKSIAQAFKNYVVNYFKNGNNMRVTLKKDNFYSIMYNSFVYAQNYLINNSNKLNINMNYSGATGIIVLFPHNNTNKIYCANIGRNRCIFYSMMGTIRLSYELYPNRASEKDRISLFKEQRKEELEKKKEEEKKEKEKEEIKNKKNNNKMNISMMTNNNDNEEKKIPEVNRQIDQKRKEAFLKEFIELDISRCIGNLAAEELGIIPGPEIGESDVKINKGKFIVIGTDSFWKYLTEEEVGNIVNLHYFSYDSEGACKDLQDLAKDRWKEKNDGAYDDISIIVIFFDSKNL